MTTDKLFDGSDAHLLPGNAELIQRLRGENLECNCCAYSRSECSCDTCWPESFTNKAADALEAADKRIAELEVENERLHQVCRDVYEVWAGSEGIPEPVTCAEAYLYQLLITMRDEVKKGLAEKQIRTEEELRPIHHDAWYALCNKLAVAREALNAMLTHMGMDEDEWNKPTFDQAREALAQIGGDDAG